jgi:cytochrome o ubiquinol oxidase subunit II
MGQHRSRCVRAPGILLGLLSITLLLGGCVPNTNMVLLDPAGPISAQEKTLILDAFWLMLIVAIPVFVLTFWFAWRYRAANTKATYLPNWDFSWKVDAVIWILPVFIVVAIGIITWQSSHALAPYKPIDSPEKPIEVDVVALDWKWLFIYPEQHVATVNQLVVPVNRPVNFKLTSDTVMTSFNIPKLGSQIYAMAGMKTRLNLMADKPGTYEGRNYQFSGEGYSDMKFPVIATQQKSFDQWVKKVRAGDKKLDMTAMKQLEKRSKADPIQHFAAIDPQLFQSIINQYHAGHHQDGMHVAKGE